MPDPLFSEEELAQHDPISAEGYKIFEVIIRREIRDAIERSMDSLRRRVDDELSKMHVKLSIMANAMKQFDHHMVEMLKADLAAVENCEDVKQLLADFPSRLRDALLDRQHDLPTDDRPAATDDPPLVEGQVPPWKSAA